jgi:putative tricarboxylic transport membrane protein
MAALIRNPKDFWTGILYVVFGGAGFWVAREYGMGSASRMGPGYFPMVLSALLLLFGAAALVRSFIVPGEPVGHLHWKGIAVVCGSTALFALLLPRAGLLIALPVMVLVAAAGSTKFKFDWKGVVGLLLLTAFCAGVFVKGLGVPMALLGSWFGG